MKLFNLLLTCLVIITNGDVIIKSKKHLKHQGRIIGEYKDKIISVMNNSVKIENFEDILVVNDSSVFLDPITEEVFPNSVEKHLLPGLWGLDNIDGKIDKEYNNYGNTGEGIIIYVIDSGVNQHPEFENRLLPGKSFGYANPEDCNGHGTHVSSTIAGKTVGVAKKANIISIRVFPCSGGSTWSNVIEAIYWIINNGIRGSVVNMSLGGPNNTLVNEAVSDLKEAGFLPIVSAGNNGGNACNYSPASSDDSFSVGCIDSSGISCSFSNEGSCVNIFAPGFQILGAQIPYDLKLLSGTSMSAPHVSGTAALIKGANPTFTNSEIIKYLLSSAAKNILNLREDDSPNLSLRIPIPRTKKCREIKKQKSCKSMNCEWNKRKWNKRKCRNFRV